MTTNSEELDRKVAEALGYIEYNHPYQLYKRPDGSSCTVDGFTPSTNWQQAGELLEKCLLDHAATRIYIDFLFSKLNNMVYLKAFDDLGIFDFDIVSSTLQGAICKAVIEIKESE